LSKQWRPPLEWDGVSENHEIYYKENLMIFRQKKTLTRLWNGVSENREIYYIENLMIFRQKKNFDPPLEWGV
jgi:hypothetical protein